MEQTVTIVNNSGKIISTGKQLFSIFQEAKAIYSEKKESVKAERALSRANTFDGTGNVQRAPSTQYAPSIQHASSVRGDDTRGGQQRQAIQYAPSIRGEDAEFRPRTLSRAQTAYYVEEDQYTLQDQPRRASYDVAASVASSRRSHRTRASHQDSQHGSHRPRSTRAPSEYSVALTADNLKSHSEAASARPSRPPTTMSRYRSPYAETVPMGQSNMDLTVVDRSVYYPQDTRQPTIVPATTIAESQYGALAPQYEAYEPQYEVYAPQHQVYAPQSEAPAPQHGALVSMPKKKKIDMNLAYGNIPPDLAERTDLDPEQGEATALVRRVEGLLDEANCVQHSAQAMIKHLQEKPEAAAAVALTLSELSAVAAKMSPAVLGLLKGGSPAVFALLASPQFLIASGLAAGITVVMFGGWKIVKKVQQERAVKAAIAYEAMAAIEAPQAPEPPQLMESMQRPQIVRAHTHEGSYYEEALVIDEELSTIESWRRGIEQFGDDESADIELITPEADRATRIGDRERYEDERDFDDARSHRSSRTHRSSKTTQTSKTSKTHKSHKSHHSHHSHRSHRSSKHGDDDDRKSSSGSSRAGSSSSKLKPRSEVNLDDSRSSRSRSRDDPELPVRPKAQRQESDLFKSLFRRKNKDASRSQLVVA
ncbi:hypothetical protein CCM_01733 [Cordyceps militaris CM01]|uniref:Uncharacterized protein n=1 Tax=Cordyceps militaris (strain CM01) TaxID=983644 RepID=G3J701_CORMM|nr:uncharacterized protein CCM_01733 [Cordyceps militaris CM01]EGX97074.1 hypothetical protein CCM_01733 [Cordyceps militaris CM01]